MSDLLIHIYRFFRTNRRTFYLLVAVFTAVTVFLASRIRFEEDISQSVHSGDKDDLTGMVAGMLASGDKLIVNIGPADSLTPVDPDSLGLFGQRFVDSLEAHFDKDFIRSIIFMTSDSAMMAMTDLVMLHLPSFLDEADYAALDSLLLPGAIGNALKANYKILLSPAGMMLKKRLQQDPLGISSIAFNKLKSLNAGDNFRIYNGYICTADLRHLLVFIVPANPLNETSMNDRLIRGLDEITGSFEKESGPHYTVQYFGAVAVAVSNARQLKKDITLTLVIAIVLIFLLIGWYFRSAMVPLLGFLPAIFGGALSLAILFLAKGKISAISLGIGSVILGLIVDYCLYLVNHFRQNRDVELTLREMSLTILLCSLTSAGAFLCLTFLNSVVLQDLGWFAALSVTGAALFTLFVLPHFLDRRILPAPGSRRSNFIDLLGGLQYHDSKWLIAFLIIIGILSFWFSRKAGFEKNMSALSYVTPELSRAESGLDRISSYKLKNLYLASAGKTAEEALRTQEMLGARIQELRESGIIRGISNAGPLLASDSLQQLKIARWNSYWSPGRKSSLKAELLARSQKLGFSTGAFGEFFDLLDTRFRPLTTNEPDLLNNPLVSDWLSITPGMTFASTILRVSEKDRQAVYRSFPADPRYVLIDRQAITERFVGNVKSDFDLLVTLSMVFVTLLLIISFGRLGLGLITAAPMFLSWLITLGIMGIAGIRFNIFNIIISSFIFGLGVDYSILMMRGLQHTLKTGRDELHSYKVSILLSALTTLFGVGALLFARHPALKSIALVSVAGIVMVVVISFVILPLIFNRFILSRQTDHKFPVTVRILIKSLVTWGNIVLIAIILMILGTLINAFLPIKRKRKEMMFHRLFSTLTKAYIAFTFAYDRKLINAQGEDFSKPAIIISNHQSLIETPAFLRLYPKIIILTTSWVYRSPIFGPIARLANYYNVDHGIESIVGQLKEKVDEGFSILIFPEAHRSYDQKIHRFHRGAFFLAEKLEVDILPIMVFGTGDFLATGDFWGRPNSFRMKILSRVPCDDLSFGKTYQERARQFRRFYIDRYAEFRAEEGTAAYYRRKLALNYILKGPVLEWYMRIKLRLENNYDIYNRLMPRHGEILDLGCGYGFISYMLMLTADDRFITGVDYDAEKIEVAGNCYSRNDHIRFVTADVTDYEITPVAGIVLSDVLHYLEPEKQEQLLMKCCRNLLPGGAILVREANAELTERHGLSRFTEFFSTRTGFNKTQTRKKELHFTSASRIKAIAIGQGLTTEVIDNKKLTSNNLFVIRKEG